MILRVKALCKQKGITGTELAKQLGVTQGAFSQYISANGNPSLKTLQKIASALNVPIQELFSAPLVGAASVCCPHCGKSISVSVSVKQTNTETEEKGQSK